MIFVRFKKINITIKSYVYAFRVYFWIYNNCSDDSEFLLYLLQTHPHTCNQKIKTKLKTYFWWWIRNK